MAPKDTVVTADHAIVWPRVRPSLRTGRRARVRTYRPGLPVRAWTPPAEADRATVVEVAIGALAGLLGAGVTVVLLCWLVHAALAP